MEITEQDLMDHLDYMIAEGFLVSFIGEKGETRYRLKTKEELEKEVDFYARN